jgi:hypothetical protein
VLWRKAVSEEAKKASSEHDGCGGWLCYLSSIEARDDVAGLGSQLFCGIDSGGARHDARLDDLATICHYLWRAEKSCPGQLGNPLL